MTLIQSLENKAIGWAWNKWAVNSIRHWKTSICGLGALASALALACQYLANLAQTGTAPDLDHIEALVAAFTAGAGLLSAKDAGTKDVRLDSEGIPIAEVVK